MLCGQLVIFRFSSSVHWQMSCKPRYVRGLIDQNWGDVICDGSNWSVLNHNRTFADKGLVNNGICSTGNTNFTFELTNFGLTFYVTMWVPLQLVHHSCQWGGRSGWGSETGRRDLSVTLGTPPSPSGRLREGEREGLTDWWPIGYTYVTVPWRNQSLNTIYHQRSRFCQSDLGRALIETSHLKMPDSPLESGMTIHSKNVPSWDFGLRYFQLGGDHSQVWGDCESRNAGTERRNGT